MVTSIVAGWLALVGAAMSAGTALTFWTYAAALSSISAAHLLAFVVGDALHVKGARELMTGGRRPM
ncbi:hypothetical protein AXK58_14225 [Tsukamurella tyrosinosolvens]|nr:hypothetical protein AXK58_14225 [Tsukamurella tyrosinosolvens]